VQAVDSAFAGSHFAEEGTFETPGFMRITGPEIAVTNAAYTLTATVLSTAVARPLTFTWEATDQAPITMVSANLTTTVVYRWANVGSKRITVTATNGIDVISDVYQLFVNSYGYLSLISYPAPPFFDDFSDPNSGWEADDSEQVRYQYLDGEYQIYLKSSEHVAYATPTLTRPYHMSIEVDARVVNESTGDYGIMFGLNPNDSYDFYAFVVHPNASGPRYALIHRRFGSIDLLVDYASSAAIQPGTAVNHLQVVWPQGAPINLYINQSLVATYSGATPFLDQREAGLYAQSNNTGDIDMRFDNFNIVQE
jgi:hypothetical protein